MTLTRLGIIGETGQLARALTEICRGKAIDLIVLNRQSLDLSASKIDIQSNLLKFKNVDAVINAAAYTAVDAAENDEIIATRVNAEAPELFAIYCKRRDIPFIHISTDYVFDGNSPTPYQVDSPTAPLGVYGRTKFLGENHVKDVGGNFAILRTSWVYDGIGKNFMTTMLRLAQDRTILSVVEDQFGRPTYAKHLARACLSCALGLLQDGEKNSGIYHVSNTGPVISWAHFARSIFEQAENKLPHKVDVKGIPSFEYPTLAKRPAYSALDISKFHDHFDYLLPGWQIGLVDAIREWAHNKN